MALVLGTNCGFVTEAPTGATTAGNKVIVDGKSAAIKHTSPVGAVKVIEIGWYANDATQEANFEVGIYADNEGNPGAVVGSLSQTNAKGTTTGWKRVTGLNIDITEETDYWLAVQLDETSTDTNTGFELWGGVGFRRKNTQTTLPSPWGSSDTSSDNYRASIYALVESTSTGTNCQVNIDDTWKEVPAMKVNIGDTWKEVAAVKTNIGDSWKEVF